MAPFEQTDIFGGTKPSEPQVTDLARSIMHGKPMTYRSHRLLMLEVARELRFDFQSLESSQRRAFDLLIDLSPDFERAARKVRQEDSESGKGIAERMRDTMTKDDEPDTSDAFEAVQRALTPRFHKRTLGWRKL